VFFGGLHENRRAFESEMTFTFRGGVELEAKPVTPGDACEPILDVALGVAFEEVDALGAVCDGVGLAVGAAGVPAIIFIRGNDGKPEPSDVYVRTCA
jgi:hypothetical protein